MNLFFRLLLILVGRAFRRRTAVDLMSTTNRKFSVWLTDQDALGHMTNSRYFSFSDLAIMDFMLKTGAMKKARAKGWLPIVAYKQCAFAKMLRFPQRFSIETRIDGWTDEVICFCHSFVRHGQIHAQAVTLARFITRDGKPVPIIDIAKAFEVSIASPELSAPSRSALDALEHARELRRNSRETR